MQKIIREEYDTSKYNVNVNTLEEIHKNACYEDNPYIPHQDSRCSNVAMKCQEGIKRTNIEDDFLPKNMLRHLSSYTDCANKDTLNNFLTEYADEQSMIVLSQDLQALLKQGGNIQIAGDVEVNNGSIDALNIIHKDSVVDFGDHSIYLNLPNANSNTENWVGIVVNGGHVVFEGNSGGIKTAANPELYAVIVRNGATLTINGGSYTGGTTVVQASEGIVTINGGFYHSQVEDARYTLNCIDTAYNAGKANIIVQGGTFVNFDPSNHTSENNTNTNFVAEGYKVVSETQSNGDIWYTVVAE